MFLRVLNRVEEAIICILLVMTTLIVFIDVVMRFGFSAGYIWSQELTLHMSAWFVLFGASYGLKEGAHIGMDAFVRLFPKIGRKVMTGLGCLLSLFYCSLILYGSWLYLAKMKMIGIHLEDLPIPTWLAHAILLIGFVFLTIRLLILFWSVVFADVDGFRQVDEAKESLELVEELSQEGTT
ncbi:MAG: C4-dicarboxylate ABC transporter permease [Proteobacteria bacterium]|nr:MAG: C4-dicarboxylate ABC transporter permease [Pseudomonadota bacterium]